ncbi:MAG: DUF4954 family protein [Rikenellaceae bacterium]|nr:DUF4954 family protein [Rikenellaceae bacterium]
MNTTTYRQLTAGEIARLETQGCTAADWAAVGVGNGFDPAYIRDSRFSGTVRIGATGAPLPSEGCGIPRRSGIYRAALHDVTVGDRVYIRNIGSHIANYTILDDTFIENTGTIECTAPTTFGVGLPVMAVNEGGGREVPLSPALSAQTAYITAMYRHRPATVGRVAALLSADDAPCPVGTIGRGTRIVGCGTIANVRITGEGARIEGAGELCEGTVTSTADDPATIRHATSAREFIMAPGSRLGAGVIVRRCFIGEAVHLDSAFSAEHSLFFANSELANGEACSVFAGPYTVSHHRASLLIAGLFSFFNAGSGANQSNHLYKTGAVHQGVHERGCKLASNAYIMLPARTGSFTVVIGRHTSHHDTSRFPFSYLVEKEEKSYLMPGINLKSYGTLRDMDKWPRRDRRVATSRDLIVFDQMNPYVMNEVVQAIEASEALAAREGIDTHTVGRVKVKDALLRKGLRLYRLALGATIGRLLDNAATTSASTSLSVPEPTQSSLSDTAALPGAGAWVDMAGLVAPRELVEGLLDRIDNGAIDSLEALEAALGTLHAGYTAYARNWAVAMLERLLGHAPTPSDIEAAIIRGRTDHETLDTLIREDGAADSSAVMATGYGIDASTPGERAADFRQVRG